MVVGGDEDIGGLDVAVEDAARVGVVGGVGDLGEEGDSSWEIEAREGLGEGAVFIKRHTEIVDAVFLACLVEDYDTRVLKLRNGFDFHGEAEPRIWRCERSGADDFERDFAVDPETAGAVDDAHAATGDFTEDLMVGKVAGEVAGGNGGGFFGVRGECEGKETGGAGALERTTRKRAATGGASIGRGGGHPL